MARKTLLAAGVLSLTKVGTWETMLAGPAAGNAVATLPDARLDTISLLGKTLCFALAPESAR